MSNWFAKNTYHHLDFENIGDLVEEKKKQNVTISLCIPTLNEENTIGSEVTLFVRELMDQYSLLDEIAIIDSGSNDRTCEKAKKAGADVYLADNIFADEVKYRGKGENLWKAIEQLKGDIICYVDADIRNCHSRFVYGLLGPLLKHSHIQYVKGFYHRPINFPNEIKPTGGGRVTEILVRPLFSLFYPELAQIIQPLSGEYAVRRQVLEKIPFPTGYGVETAHLIDVYRLYGMEVFAQTDLDTRIHDNQSISALGKMSFHILQAFYLRLVKEKKIPSNIDSCSLFTDIYQSFFTQNDEYIHHEQKIPHIERPPMISNPKYKYYTHKATKKHVSG